MLARPLTATVAGLVVASATVAFASSVGRGISFAGGGFLCLAVLASGTAFVRLVSGVSPPQSLPIALLTYGFQVAVVTAFLAAVAGGATALSGLETGYVAAGVIAAVAVWTVAMVWSHSRERHLLYDLDDHSRSTSHEPSA